jgi:NAD(P)-dependent dehydrogenase (short-subunit alcohol dehydrogenase family)
MGMERFEGRIAVVTGGGTGMGRELVRQLAAEGCHVSTCDVSAEAMAETQALALGGAPSGTKVTTFVADVSDEAQVIAFREAISSELVTDHIHLLFNNAGIGGGGSMIGDDRADWERTFGVDWGGVYNGTRTFLPMLMAADEGHVVNTSSINGLWGTIGPITPHTAYSAAKFAVRGFSEALIADFRVNAPHLRVSVVMPGHIGTSIVINSSKAHGREPESLSSDDLAKVRLQLAARGLPVDGISDDDLRKGVQMMGEAFRDTAPTTAARAATIILDGVRQNRWRILVGEDAEILDAEVRADPEHAYDPEFWDAMRAKGLFGGFGS